ncbi:hypothetical protein Bca52824_023739 [Brassica carinata]|uniref:Uncharacterized protein n=1 Tax=Brassica carinata TaxID=52824 RepID=A0A8X7VJ51_BRACI|nr:hypothetical protein Bca52824_023739 [Brassica carinata]
MSYVFNLRALETRWSKSATSIEKYTEIDGKVNVDSKNVNLKRGTETDCSLKVSQACNERAARRYLSTLTERVQRLASRGYILSSESVLKEICTPEELEILKATSHSNAQGCRGRHQLREVSDENEPTGNPAFEAGADNNVTLAVSGKGKGKVTECADYISNVGKGTSVKDIEYYVEEVQCVSLDIPTAIELQLCVEDNAVDNLQVSQIVTKEKGKAVAEEEAVVRNLSSEFDGSSRERAIMIGRGYPCDGDGDDTKILGMTKSDSSNV